MEPIEILKNPIDKKFYKLISETKNTFYFTSPYINDEPIENIMKNINKNVKIKGITFLCFATIRKQILSLNSLKKLINKGILKTSKEFLHSKIYIFDNKKAIITSSNLTKAGLTTNYEYGVLISDKKLIMEIKRDFDTLYLSKNFGKITKKTLIEIENKIKLFPSFEKRKYGNMKFDLEYDTNLSLEDTKIISNNLKGWKKLIFDTIDKNFKKTFFLKEFEKFKNEFKEKYPNNNNIEFKVQQQLQYLRDLGLIEFVKRGFYRKLW
jgi:phosphatidylserine/phosphatidylglycerophosphate/cardiolipin synthase-like enzyme